MASFCCAHCQATATTALKCCARCKLAYYCDRTCQRAHWPQHKQSCQAPPQPQPMSPSHQYSFGGTMIDTAALRHDFFAELAPYTFWHYKLGVLRALDTKEEFQAEEQRLLAQGLVYKRWAGSCQGRQLLFHNFVRQPRPTQFGPEEANPLALALGKSLKDVVIVELVS